MSTGQGAAAQGRPVAVPRVRAPRSFWQQSTRRLLKNRLAMVGLAVVLLYLIIAIVAPLVSPYDPAKQNYDAILLGPTGGHPLGTDGLGRDSLSRLVFGARTSLAVGLFTQLIVLTVGIPVGLVAAFSGRRSDNLLMRFVDIVFAFPDLLLIILLRAIFGGSIFMVFLAIGLVNWVIMARMVRGQALSLKEQEFVLAAKAIGVPWHSTLIRHVLPNALGPVVVLVAFGVPRAIFAEAALSYIGIGVTPPTPSWGTMVQDGYSVIFATPYPVLFPAVAIAVVMLAFTFLGDGLRDALDPRHAGLGKMR
ncbi:MAG: ABC transporter permease [Chloroflexi bacterium]|nr:ABC transporter permease [Chloroflexota bacterium]